MAWKPYPNLFQLARKLSVIPAYTYSEHPLETTVGDQLFLFWTDPDLNLCESCKPTVASKSRVALVECAGRPEGTGSLAVALSSIPSTGFNSQLPLCLVGNNPLHLPTKNEGIIKELVALPPVLWYVTIWCVGI